MKYLTGIIFIALIMNTTTIFDFTSNTDLENWRVVDDVVMGGRSSGTFELSPEGHGKFKGEISLENNGGFSSVRYSFSQMEVSPDDHIRIRVKGDGKKYQFRIKHDRRYRYSYLHEFETSGDWQTVDVPLENMYPVFRGRELDLPDFDQKSMEELVFLIGNKKPESFELLIDKIELIQD
ncbi:MAG: CIA30 family protein [Gracilimonas sp.]|nr:CIA30 family protein [Gracilimonas sp.]